MTNSFRLEGLGGIGHLTIADEPLDLTTGYGIVTHKRRQLLVDPSRNMSTISVLIVMESKNARQ